MAMHPDLASAIDAVLAKDAAQSDEFRKRLRKLIENAVTVGRVKDSDVREVLDLVTPPDDDEF